MAQAPAAAPPPAPAAVAAAGRPQAAGPIAVGLARPVVVPPEFGGTSADDWPTFLARFDACCSSTSSTTRTCSLAKKCLSPCSVPELYAVLTREFTFSC